MNKDDMFVHTIRALGVLVSGTGYDPEDKSELFHSLAGNIINLTDNPDYFRSMFQEMLGTENRGTLN